MISNEKLYDIDSLFQAGIPQAIDLPDFNAGNVPSSVNQFTEGVGGESLVDGKVAGIMESSDFKTGVSGWQIKPDGTAEFQTIIAGAYIQVFVQASIPISLHINDIWYDSDGDNHPYRAECVGADQITAGEWVSIRDAGAGATQTTIFYEATAPASGMITGDYWIDSDDNKIYRYDGASWGEVQDDQIAAAISDAATAQSTADGKVYVYKQNDAPAGMVAGDVGDLWLDTDDGNKLYRYSGSAWEEVQDDGIATAITNAATAQSTADSKIITFYQAGIPTSTDIGDLWIDTDDKNKLYRAEMVGANEIIAGEWVEIRDTDIAQAIADAGTAQSTADSKIISFFQDAIPTATDAGDLWFDTNDKNKCYRATNAGDDQITAGEWVAVRDTDIGQAITNAATAQSAADAAQADATQAISDASGAQGTADGKVTTFYQTAAPTAEGTGDLWIDTDDGNKLYRWSGSAWTEIQDDDIATAITNAATAQNTADGKIVTFYQAGIPTATDAGDLWVDTDDGNKMYRSTNAGDDQIIAGEWIEIQDDAIATAQATADGKVVTFYQDAAPTAEGTGDLWVDTNDTNKLYRWSGSAWVSVVDSDIAQAISDAAGAQSTADGKIITFYQDGEPTGGESSTGDIWFDTNDKMKQYRYSGSAWQAVRDTDIAQAITDASNAQSTADGKIITFYQDAEPTAVATGDLWIDTNDTNKLYRWSGSAWTSVVDTDIATAIANASTAQTTADGKIVTFYQTTQPTADGVGDIWIDTDDDNKPYRWSGSAWQAMNNPSEWADVLDGATTKPADSADVTSANAQALSWLTAGTATEEMVFENTKVGGDTIQYKIGNAGMSSFGDGSDGAHTTTGNETLTSDKYYTNLTVATGHTLNPAGYRIFCTGTLTLEGTGKISGNGNDGRDGGDGGNGGTGVGGTAGTAGTGVSSLADGYLKGSLPGKAGGAGNVGGVNAAGSNGVVGNNGVNTVNSIGSNGVDSGAGGNGGNATGGGPNGGTGGSAGVSGIATTSNVKLIANWHLMTLLDISSTGSSVKFDNSASASGGGGGGGGGGSAGTSGGGGGGGGAGSATSGRIIAIYARVIVVGASASITANGGVGGDGGNGGNGGNGALSNSGGGGGGGAGSGGNGGQLIFAYNLLTNNGTISVNAGVNGSIGLGGLAGGDGNGLPGSDGSSSSNSTAGTIRYFELSL